MSAGFTSALRRNPSVALGVVLLGLVVMASLLAPWLGTLDPMKISPIHRMRPPGETLWFGGDLIGRDVYSRTLYGARVSLAVGALVAVLSTIIGLSIGIFSGYVRWLDAIAMRIMDGVMSIPSILLAIAMISLAGASLRNVVIAITIAEVPRVARLVRGVVLSLRDQPYVEAAIAVGTPFHLVLWRHILPSAAPPLMVQASYIAASAILIEAALSFIGAGTPPSIPSWGNIIAEGRSVFQIAPHIVLFPGAAIALTVLAINLVGDGLRDAYDPRFVGRL